MNEREMFENAHKLLETHFKMKVDNEETLNAWKLFKEDYVKQIEENQAYKDKEDKIKEYCEAIKEKYKFFHESNTTDVSAILEIIGDE